MTSHDGRRRARADLTADLRGLLNQHAELTLVGGTIVHSAGAVTDAVGAVLGEDPVSAGTAVSHVHCH